MVKKSSKSSSVKKTSITESSKEPAPPPPPMPKSKLTKDELKQFRNALLALRDQLTKQVGSMESEALTKGDSDVSVDHMADHGSETFDQDFTLGLIENEERTIQEIDEALDRIEEGHYGVCERCHESPAKANKIAPHIPKARLEAIPWTRFCVDHAREAERDREVEEAQEDEE
ncbi:MAG: hypothetical protein JNJ88_08510 [Planctomycetes bacterium]|nr:hypothetical protein [Planctomycetota bacterium]